LHHFIVYDVTSLALRMVETPGRGPGTRSGCHDTYLYTAPAPRTADLARCEHRFGKPVLYPLSYEGIVPICRYFVFLRPGKNTTSC